MSEAPDKDSKTEEPTEKKISDALEKGNIPVSREAALFASLGAILLSLSFFVVKPVAGLTETLQLFLDKPGEFALEKGSDVTALLWEVATVAGKFALPMALLLAGAGLVSGFAQNAPRLVLDRVRPKWSRIAPGAGLKRMFGAQAFIEFAKSLAKFLAIGGICLALLESQRRAAMNAMISDPAQVPGLVLSMTVSLVSAVCVATIVLVCLDLFRARFQWHSGLRMTRQELKDEMRQSDGDPAVKARQRSLARDRARRRMIAQVPKASVVIANPTHYAIALLYDRKAGGAPLVLAKGTDLIALKIREVAAQHNVPVVENRELARAMYDQVEIDQWIPAEFYRAVAKILFYLYSRGQHAVG